MNEFNNTNDSFIVFLLKKYYKFSIENKKLYWLSWIGHRNSIFKIVLVPAKSRRVATLPYDITPSVFSKSRKRRLKKSYFVVFAVQDALVIWIFRRPQKPCRLLCAYGVLTRFQQRRLFRSVHPRRNQLCSTMVSCFSRTSAAVVCANSTGHFYDDSSVLFL